MGYTWDSACEKVISESNNYHHVEELKNIRSWDKKNDKIICQQKKECGAQEYIRVLKDNYWLEYQFGFNENQVIIKSSNLLFER